MKEYIFDKTDRILVVAPHPDDETIGCGGLIVKYHDIVDVVCLSDGRKGFGKLKDVDENELVITRKKEFDAAMSIAGVEKYDFLSLPDTQLKKFSKEIRAIDVKPYTHIIIPNRNDGHPDHISTNKILRKHVKKNNKNALIWEYEVWVPLSHPNRFINIEKEIEEKRKMILQYKSQNAYLNYTNLSIGLSQYRGACSNFKYSEAFYEEEKKSIIITILKSIYKFLPKFIKKSFRKVFRKNHQN